MLSKSLGLRVVFYLQTALWLVCLWAPRSAESCTTFLLSDGDRCLVGKSYDYHIGYGYAMFNKRAVAKKALLTLDGVNPASWVSRYASLSFNQFGREFPHGGINEKGLVIEIMWLEESRYPKLDTRPAVGELQWIQYHLDTAADVGQVMKNAGKLLLVSDYARVHYLACDRAGKCAVFEYLQGRLVVTSPDEMKTKVLTNNTYVDSVAFLEKHRGFGGALTMPAGKGSLQRFVRASWLAKKFSQQTKHPDKVAFSILDSVSMGAYTKWNLVYDIKKMQILFRVRGNWTVKKIDFNAFNRSCKTPVKMLDLNKKHPADVTGYFTDYNAQENQKLVRQSLTGISLQVPQSAIEAIADIGTSYRCTLLRP